MHKDSHGRKVEVYINTQANCIICNGPIYWIVGENYGKCMRSVCRAKQPPTIVRNIKGR